MIMNNKRRNTQQTRRTRKSLKIITRAYVNNEEDERELMHCVDVKRFLKRPRVIAYFLSSFSVFIFLSFFVFFLVKDTQLYKRLCPSVCWSVGPLVRPSVSLSVCQHKLKSEKTHISAPAHPSATDGCVSGLVSLFWDDVKSADMIF